MATDLLIIECHVNVSALISTITPLPLIACFLPLCLLEVLFCGDGDVASGIGVVAVAVLR